MLNDSVEAFLRRDYFLDDSIVDKTEEIRSLAWVLAGPKMITKLLIFHLKIEEKGQMNLFKH
jgi:hypothetical protein